MTIDESYRLVQFLVNKNQQGNISPDQFNLIAPRAQVSFINDRITPKYDEKGQKIGWQSSQSVRRELVPVIKYNSSVTVSAGVAAYPSDYIDYDTITTSDGNLLTECTQDEIAGLNKSLIKPPSATYPKFVQTKDGLNIYPTNLTPIKLTYVRKPADPVWGYTTVNGKPVYASGSSTQFELPSITHLELVMKMLQMVGVNLSLMDITQFAMAKEQQGV